MEQYRCEGCGCELFDLGEGPPPTRCEDCIPETGQGSRLVDQLTTNLHQLRRKAGIEREELARRAGMSADEIALAEREAAREPGVTRALRLAHSIGVSIDDLADRIYWNPGEIARSPGERRPPSERLSGFFLVLPANVPTFDPAPPRDPIASRKELAEIFGENVRSARERRHLFQKTLADAAGLSREGLSYIERGIHETTIETMRSIQALAARAALLAGALVVALLLAPSMAFATTLPATITENMTLTAAGNPYTGSPTIASGVTVKVEPGTKLTLGSLTVEGTLLAEGTAENPVRFTGIKGEKVGEWRAITFVPGSGSSVLDHVEVANGGGRDSGYFDYNNGDINVEGSSPAIINSTIRDAGGYGIKVTGGGGPEIANDLFSNAGDHAAITYVANSEQSGKINIHGNEIKGGAAGISVTVYTSANVNSGTLSGNTVTGTEVTGVTYSGPDVPGDITENTLSGNKTNYIQVGGTVAHSSTWNDGGSRVRLTGLTIASGVTLQITAGVHLVSPTMTVKGTLLANGTAESPVRFTGMNEEKVGEWRAITFVPGSGSSILDHVEVANGGNADSGYYNYNNGDINVEGASPAITNSTIRDAGGYGVKVSGGGAPEIANDSFSNAGEHSSISYTANSEQSGKINIHGNEIEGRGAGISATVYGGANVNLSISGNHIEGGTSGISATVFSGATGNAEALSGNTVVNTEGIGISYSGPDVPGDITENTLSGNKLSYIQVGGTVAHSSTWNQGTPIRLTGLTVASGVTLKITTGVHLMNPTMTVEGTLLAEGTAANPVRFTGMNEAKVGEWKAIFFKPGSGSSVLNHVEVANGGNADPGYYNYNNADIEIDGSSPTIINSTIRDAGGYGIKVPEGGGPEIANDAFSNAGEHSAISYTAGSGKSGEVNIHGNFIEGGGGGIAVTVNAAATGTRKRSAATRC